MKSKTILFNHLPAIKPLLKKIALDSPLFDGTIHLTEKDDPVASLGWHYALSGKAIEIFLTTDNTLVFFAVRIRAWINDLSQGHRLHHQYAIGIASSPLHLDPYQPYHELAELLEIAHCRLLSLTRKDLLHTEALAPSQLLSLRHKATQALPRQYPNSV